MLNYSLADFSARLKGNTANTITYFNESGVRCQKTFSDFYDDVMLASRYMQSRGMLGVDQSLVICGKMGYHWLLSAMVCVLSNTRFVALPESLLEDEVEASLAGLTFTGAVLDKAFVSMKPFSGCSAVSMAEFIQLKLIAGEGAVDGCDPSFDLSKIEHAAGLVAFTSGSTASKRLKAFSVSLASSLQFTRRFMDLYEIRNDDNWLICHTFSHIVHFEYALGGLFWGYNITLCGVINLLMQGAQLAPSVLVTVPAVYEKIAEQIRYRFSLSGEDALAALERTRVVDDKGQIVRQPISAQAQALLGNRLKMVLIGASPSSSALQTFLLQNGLPLYEGYGMSETNMISCHVPGRSKLSTTGPAWPGIEMKLDQDHCVWVRTTPLRSSGYLNAGEDENNATFKPDGWVNTGDIGEIDENGYLSIVGRTKDIIVNSGGKNINPSAIETRLNDIPGVSHAVVFGDGQPFLTAVLAPSEQQRLPDRDTLEFHVQRINQTLPDHERVLGFIGLTCAFSELDGTLTRSGKPRRKNVIERYQDQLNSLYG